MGHDDPAANLRAKPPAQGQARARRMKCCWPDCVEPAAEDKFLCERHGLADQQPALADGAIQETGRVVQLQLQPPDSAAVAREPRASPAAEPDRRRYKVVTQRDEFFGGAFSPEALEQLLNEYAADGWRVVSMTATDVGSLFGSAAGKGSGASRRELVVLLEKAV
jgi:hypothetical protein